MPLILDAPSFRLDEEQNPKRNNLCEAQKRPGNHPLLNIHLTRTIGSIEIRLGMNSQN
jgi:hypothetical protein